jgi:quinolinate synthase
MKINEIQSSIGRLKKENDICILAHSYQSQDIIETADFTGDSYALSMKAKEVKEKTIILCGVRFMAETVKIISPRKKVILSDPNALCPMAEQIDAQLLTELKKQYPGYTVAAYINTSAETKALCDVCVTSSSAVRIIKNIKNNNILFVPDCNLGDWIKKQVPSKNIVTVSGGCPTHLRMTVSDVNAARNEHPGALLLVHPECRPDVTSKADFAGSTSAIMKYAENSNEKEFIIGTENSITEHLRFACPDKKFYPLSKECVCHNMRLTDLAELYECVKGLAGEEIVMSDDLIRAAKRPIDEMEHLSNA